jgi:hypothetical protein
VIDAAPLSVRAANPAGISPCHGVRLESGLLVETCLHCDRQWPNLGGLNPAAEFIESDQWAGWRCVNQVKVFHRA